MGGRPLAPSFQYADDIELIISYVNALFFALYKFCVIIFCDLRIKIHHTRLWRHFPRAKAVREFFPREFHERNLHPLLFAYQNRVDMMIYVIIIIKSMNFVK